MKETAEAYEKRGRPLGPRHTSPSEDVGCKRRAGCVPAPVKDNNEAQAHCTAQYC